MIALVAAFLVQQAIPLPVASAQVDRDEVAAGETVTLTVRIETRGSEPLEVSEEEFKANIERDRVKRVSH